MQRRLSGRETAHLDMEADDRYVLGKRDQFGNTATFAATDRNLFDV